MKILTKRAIALFIDALILGIFIVLCQQLLPIWFEKLGTIGHIILFIPLLFRDIFFRNASIGKKIMNIAIYNNEWKVPKFSLLIKRAALMLTVGFILFWKAKFVDKNIIVLFEWEKNALGTQVVDKKLMKKLTQDSASMSGDYSQNISELYDLYLRDIYLK